MCSIRQECSVTCIWEFLTLLGEWGHGGVKVPCKNGGSGVCNSLENTQAYECPVGSEIAFGFGIHMSDKFMYPNEARDLKANMRSSCDPGKTSCSLPSPVDTYGDDNTLIFAICQGDLDFEIHKEYKLHVEVEDPTGLTARNYVAVKVGEYNEAPKVWDQVIEVNEDAVVAGKVGNPVRAYDPDPQDTLKFSIIGGNGMSYFDITSCDNLFPQHFVK